MRLLLPALLLATTVGCGGKPPKKSSEKPAKVEAHPSEQDIYRIVLTPKAVQRLQISTVPAAMRSVPRTRMLGGDIAIPDGQRIPITAPLTGTLQPVEGQSLPAAGQTVTPNQILLKLTPMLPPEREVPNAPERVQMANAQAMLVTAQIQADGDMQQAKAQVDGAKIAFDRAKKLLADKAGSRRAVDDAEATLNIATKAMEAAAERKALLGKLTLEAKTGAVPVVDIRATHGGIIQTVSAQVGQVVNAGAALFEIVDLKQLWLRVPVYAGQVNEIDNERDVSVGALNGSSSTYLATPIQAPPTANALAASIDLYYRVDNTSGRFRPGERVSVHVPLRGEEQSLVVPRAAILRDIHGTPWVYVQSGEHEFRRVRTAVQFTTDEFAVLSLGPTVGKVPTYSNTYARLLFPSMKGICPLPKVFAAGLADRHHQQRDVRGKRLLAGGTYENQRRS
jgi:RND family efflux transporter MFP subunit